MLVDIRNEFILKKFSLGYDQPADFLRAQWQTTDRKCFVYLLYRWIIAILFSTTLSYAFLHHVLYKGSVFYFYIYLTNWGSLINATYAVISAALTTMWYFSAKYQDHIIKLTTTTIDLKFLWFLQTICPLLAVTVTGLYWTFVHNKGGREFPVDALNILNHVCNSVFIFFDLLIVANPVRILHFIYPLVLAVIYAIFTIFYYIFDGVNVRGEPFIYKNLDWSRPSWTGPMTLATFCMTVILHTLIYFLYRFKLFIYKRVFRTEQKFKCENQVPNSTV